MKCLKYLFLFGRRKARQLPDVVPEITEDGQIEQEEMAVFADQEPKVEETAKATPKEEMEEPTTETSPEMESPEMPLSKEEVTETMAQAEPPMVVEEVAKDEMVGEEATKDGITPAREDEALDPQKQEQVEDVQVVQEEVQEMQEDMKEMQEDVQEGTVQEVVEEDVAAKEAPASTTAPKEGEDDDILSHVSAHMAKTAAAVSCVATDMANFIAQSFTQESNDMTKLKEKGLVDEEAADKMDEDVSVEVQVIGATDAAAEVADANAGDVEEVEEENTEDVAEKEAVKTAPESALPVEQPVEDGAQEGAAMAADEEREAPMDITTEEAAVDDTKDVSKDTFMRGVVDQVSKGAGSMVELVNFMSYKEGKERGFEVILDDFDKFSQKFFPCDKDTTVAASEAEQATSTELLATSE